MCVPHQIFFIMYRMNYYVIMYRTAMNLKIAVISKFKKAVVTVKIFSVGRLLRSSVKIKQIFNSQFLQTLFFIIIIWGEGQFSLCKNVKKIEKVSFFLSTLTGLWLKMKIFEPLTIFQNNKILKIVYQHFIYLLIDF